MTRTREGGSVASYIMVAIVLAVLVLGGVFIVQKTGQKQPITPPGVTVRPSPVAKSPSPKPSQKPSPTPAPTIRPPVTGTAPTEPLPKTGPSDNWISLGMLAVLVGTIVSYVQSLYLRLERSARQAVD